MRQTAVEWLINELKKSKHYQQMINEVHQNSTIVSDIFEQAKEMEKKQIFLALKNCCFSISLACSTAFQ